MQEAIEKGAPVVFITGCSIGGIGAAVFASSRSLKSMEGIIHPNILKLKVDVTSDESVKNAIDYIYSECGRLDILISNAGLPGIGPLLDASLDDVKKIMGTNYYGLIRLVNETIPRMAKRRFGLVVAIGSILGELGTPFTGLYNASKAALHAYTETLAMECTPLGVNVMLVAPGSIMSNIANNARYDMPCSSLYQEYQRQIDFVMFQSQMKEYGAMPTAEFARQLADKVLAPSPVKYFATGGMSWSWWFLKWLPRTMVLNLFWNGLSKPPNIK